LPAAVLDLLEGNWWILSFGIAFLLLLMQIFAIGVIVSLWTHGSASWHSAHDHSHWLAPRPLFQHTIDFLLMRRSLGLVDDVRQIASTFRPSTSQAWLGFGRDIIVHTHLRLLNIVGLGCGFGPGLLNGIWCWWSRSNRISIVAAGICFGLWLRAWKVLYRITCSSLHIMKARLYERLRAPRAFFLDIPTRVSTAFSDRILSDGDVNFAPAPRFVPPSSGGGGDGSDTDGSDSDDESEADPSNGDFHLEDESEDEAEAPQEGTTEEKAAEDDEGALEKETKSPSGRLAKPSADRRQKKSTTSPSAEKQQEVGDEDEEPTHGHTDFH